jgi:hypothetical protein
MQGFIDFLNFRLFISPYVLVAFYYIGALGMPVASWLFLLWIRRRFAITGEIHDAATTALVDTTGRKNRVLFYLMFLACFLCMEVVWRMLFEFLMAYLQMREALLKIAG